MGRVVAVVGGSGGCGSSALAVLLAQHWSRRGRTVLVDLDGGGAGLEVLLGVEAAPGVRWADLEHARGLGADDLVGVLPTWEGIEVLSEDRRVGGGSPEPRAAVLDALVAGSATVVLDTSARVVACVPDVAQVLRTTPTVLVTRQDVAGVAAGLRVGSTIGPVRGVVLRRCAGTTVAPAEAGHLLAAPVLGRIGDDPGLRGAVERGLGPRPGRSLRRVVDRAAQAVG